MYYCLLICSFSNGIDDLWGGVLGCGRFLEVSLKGWEVYYVVY